MRDYFINQILSDNFISVHVLDLDAMSYTEVYAVPEVHDALGETGSIRNQWSPYFVGIAEKDYAGKVDSFLTSVDQREQAQPTQGEEPGVVFETMKFGWCKLGFLMVPGRTEDESPSQLAIVRKMDEQRMQQLKDERLAVSRLMQELKEAQRANTSIRYLDDLTGSLNRRGFFKRAEEILKQNPGKQYAVCYSDIRNMSYINDAFGYESGNDLLRCWSQSVRELMRDDEVFGRMSGDYFAALLNMENEESRSLVEVGFQKVTDEIRYFFRDRDPYFKVEIYSGIYLISENDLQELSVERVLDRAFAAQKFAKESGKKQIVFYNDVQWQKRLRGIQISQHLSQALRDGEVVGFLQPQYNGVSGRIVGAEVLCRWNSTVLENLYPGEFIPVLEENGQIYELDTYIWEQSCKLLRHWLDLGDVNVVPLSINLSRQDVLQDGLLEFLKGLLKKYDLTPDYLRLEITESAYMDEPEKLIDIVAKLKEFGFTIEMDDFGSGFSSLNMLKELSIDVLKMDLRFLEQRGSGEKGGKIVSSVIRMAQALNMLVIAEGVETEEQVQGLKNMGCSFMQGFYYAKPMPPEDFECLLRTQDIGQMRSRITDASLVYINDILDMGSKSAYIFNHYSSSAAVLEYDGVQLEILTINDNFLHAMGDYTGEVRKYMKDGLALNRKEDRPRVVDALETAIAEGEASCELYIPLTEQWVHITFRHVVRGRAADYLFSEAVNTTEEHRLTTQLNNLSEEMDTEMSMMPAGAFRYEAEGEQKFAYVSEGVLTLLKFPSLEAFQQKFHNRFPEMVYEKDRDRVLGEIDEQIAETGYKDYCEYRIEMADGSLKWVYDHGRLVTDDNGKKWFYVVIADMDQERKRRQNVEIEMRKYEVAAYLPGMRLIEYDPETKELCVEERSEGGGLHTRRVENFPKYMASWGVTPEMAQFLKGCYSQAMDGSDGDSGRIHMFSFEGTIPGETFGSFDFYYSDVRDEDGKLLRIVGCLLKK